MTVLIVGENLGSNCPEIITEVKKRGYKTEIRKAVNSAWTEILLDSDNEIKGVILELDIPKKNGDNEVIRRGGEEILRLMSKENINNIPVLIYSKTEVSSNYIQVFDQMKSFDKNVFYTFLDEVEKRQH